jgi:TonB-dependent receptor-like protein
MRIHHHRLAVICVSAAMLSVRAAAPLGGQVIHVRLLEPNTDKPASATITLVTPDNATVAQGTPEGSDGEVALRAPAAGNYRLRAERPGYPTVITPAMALRTGDDVAVVLRAAPQVELKPVTVTANNRRPPGRAGGFYDRMQRYKTGTFITRDQIDKARPFFVTDLLRTVPGVIVEPNPRGFGSQVRSLTGCRPNVFLDGLPFPLAGESIDDIVSPMQLEGLEVYPTAAEVPFDLHPVDPTCGAIALWTRSGK